MPPQETEWKKGKGEVPRKHPMYRVSINYTTTGSHQGGPLYSYQEHFCMFSKNKKTIDSLTTFLSKYSKKVTDKNKKTKKKGGGNRRRTGNKKLLVKLQTKNMKVLNACKKTATNKYQEKKCLDNFNKTWEAYSVFLRDNGNKVFTPKQQREVMKKFFGKSK